MVIINTWYKHVSRGRLIDWTETVMNGIGISSWLVRTTQNHTDFLPVVLRRFWLSWWFQLLQGQRGAAVPVLKSLQERREGSGQRVCSESIKSNAAILLHESNCNDSFCAFLHTLRFCSCIHNQSKKTSIEYTGTFSHYISNDHTLAISFNLCDIFCV